MMHSSELERSCVTSPVTGSVLHAASSPLFTLCASTYALLYPVVPALQGEVVQLSTERDRSVIVYSGVHTVL